jgi:hypothetical protein
MLGLNSKTRLLLLKQLFFQACFDQIAAITKSAIFCSLLFFPLNKMLNCEEMENCSSLQKNYLVYKKILN